MSKAVGIGDRMFAGLKPFSTSVSHSLYISLIDNDDEIMNLLSIAPRRRRRCLLWRRRRHQARCQSLYAIYIYILYLGDEAKIGFRRLTAGAHKGEVKKGREQ